VYNNVNHLIESLHRNDRRRLLDVGESVELVLSQVLSERGAPTRHVYFPTGAFISLVTSLDGKPALGVGMVGIEGMVGAQLSLGVLTTPFHAIVQGDGSAWRIASIPFRKELAHSPAMQRRLSRYVYVLMEQLATSAACARFHQIDARLARWLLMTQDRAQANRFRVTHEFLAYILRIRRAGITSAAGALQRSGIIKYHRGEIQVINRRELENAACSCYATDCDAYRQFFH
jgi:CRP-like cAMP-binding protein